MQTNETIQQARLGDESAWKDLINEHQQAIFRLVYLILGDSDDAKDVAQETFIRAYDKFARYDSRKPLRPWLYRIAANLAYNYKRSSKRRQTALKHYEQDKDSVSHPEALSIQKIESQELHEAVTRLRRGDQEVIYLRYFLDLSVDETAESLGVAQGTVKSRLHRALKHLGGVIQRDFPMLQKRFEHE